MKKKCVCGNDFSFIEIYLKVNLSNEKLICENCGRKYKETIVSRIFTSIYVLIPIIFLYLIKDEIGFWKSVLISLMIFLLLSIIFTPLIKLQELIKEEK